MTPPLPSFQPPSSLTSDRGALVGPPSPPLAVPWQPDCSRASQVRPFSAHCFTMTVISLKTELHTRDPGLALSCEFSSYHSPLAGHALATLAFVAGAARDCPHFPALTAPPSGVAFQRQDLSPSAWALSLACGAHTPGKLPPSKDILGWEWHTPVSSPTPGGEDNTEAS